MGKKKKAESVDSLRERIRDCLQRMAALRDELRVLVSDANDVLESCDQAGLDDFIEDLSQHI